MFTNKIAALVVVISLLVGGSAIGETVLGWSDYHVVNYLEPTTGGWAWVVLDKPTKQFEEGFCSSRGLFLSDSGIPGAISDILEAGQRIYSTLLAAMLSGKKIRFRVFRHPSKDFCTIERIRLEN